MKMTRREAIYQLKRIKDESEYMTKESNLEVFKKNRQALDLAIKSIKSGDKLENFIQGFVFGVSLIFIIWVIGNILTLLSERL